MRSPQEEGSRRRWAVPPATSRARDGVLLLAVVVVYLLTSPWCGAWALSIAHVLRWWHRWDRRTGASLGVAAIGALVARPWSVGASGLDLVDLLGLVIFLAGWWGALVSAQREVAPPRAGRGGRDQQELRRQLVGASLPVGHIGRVRSGIERGRFVTVQEDDASEGWYIRLWSDETGAPSPGDRDVWIDDPLVVDEWLAAKLDIEWLT